MKIFIASDHAGFSLKESVRTYLEKKGLNVVDLGTYSPDSVNWVEYGAKVAAKVAENAESDRGILICGTGIGMSIAANKFPRIRAALANDTYAAEMSRRHNNANILTMGARVIDKDRAIQIVDIWLNTPFDGGRHQGRLEYLSQQIEKDNFK